MFTVITGDIVHSGSMDTENWIKPLKEFLKAKGESPKAWEIYRGDEFQLGIESAEEALISAIQLKAVMKTFKNLDVRLSIGIGTLDFKGDKITESNGTAFVNSGRTFDELKKHKSTLAICTDNPSVNKELNLLLKLALTFIDHWSATSAEIVDLALRNPGSSQEELAKILGISQSAVSHRLRRANFDLVLELDDYFRDTIKELSHGTVH